jgi:plastocyanin
MLPSSIIASIIAAFLIIMSMIASPITSSTAPLTTGNNSGTNVTSIINSTKIFQSHIDGIRVQVPNGWVVEDIENTDPNRQQYEKITGAGGLAVLCPQAETLPKIGGGYYCSRGAEDSVTIGRYADLKSRPEFAVLARENKSITISDLLAYHIQFFERLGFTDFRLLENIDRAVNVTDSQTNQTIATAPAKYVEMSLTNSEGRHSDRDFNLFVLGNDGNTGYVLIASVSKSTVFSQTPEKLPSEHQQIFDSLELLQQSHSSNSTSGITTSAPPSLAASSTPQRQQEQQPQLQQEQNHQVSVLISYGSASRSNFAFQPNQVHVNVGDTITWVNNDRVPHTVTSGQNATSDGQFDSGRMVLAATFEHTFTKAGEYPYFCSLHPNMVRTISVS